jgi:precorrin-3B methylase
LLDKYVTNVKALVNNPETTEYDMFREMKRAQRAIGEYEEKFLLPRYH